MTTALSRSITSAVLAALAAFSAVAGEPSATPALDPLEAIEVPDTDVNFSGRQSTIDRPPQTGPLLHRAFAQRWRDQFEANAAMAERVIFLAKSGACGGDARTSAQSWHNMIESANAEAEQGREKWATVPQIAARHYMRATRLTENLLQSAEMNGCKPD